MSEPSSRPWAFALSCAFLLAALFGLRLINDADMGFHLAAGRWIFENHRAPSLDSFTYTAEGRPYLDMEWLYQFGLFLTWRLAGYSGISLLHIAFALLAFAFLWKRLQGPDFHAPTAILGFALAVLSCEPRFRVRPEVPTWALLSVTLWILESRVRGQRDLLYLLPFLQLLWVNSEGLFFLGPLLMGLYLIPSGPSPRRLDPKLLKFFGWSLAACLFNPHFLKGALFPFTFLSSLGSSGIYHYAVQEFQPPWSFQPAPGYPHPFFLYAYKAFSGFLLLGLLATAGSRKLREWLLALAFFLLSATAMRNIPLFVIACAPLAATCWSGIQWRPWRSFREKVLDRPLAAWVLVLFLAGFAARLATNAHYVHERLTDRFGLGLDKGSQPVAATEFLRDHHLDGRILNDLDSGDWLDWRGPSKTFIDGRLDVIGTASFTEYVQAQSPGGLLPLAEKQGAQVILFKYQLMPYWLSDLHRSPDWRLVFVDGLVAVFIKKGYADQVPAVAAPEILTRMGIAPELASQAKALTNLPPPSFGMDYLEGFYRRSDYSFQLLDLGIFFWVCEDPASSELFFLEGIRRTQGRHWDYFFNLGALYAYHGRDADAVPCMQRAIQVMPKNDLVRKILGLPPVP